MSRIHFVGGEKGGVGKSVVARLMCQWLIESSSSFSALDADVSHGALVRAYPRVASPIDLSVFESADQIMDRALARDREVLIDLPAKSLRHLMRWIREGDVMTLARETGIEIVFWYVTDGTFQSGTALQEMLDQLDPEISVIVVENRRFTEDFTSLEGSSTWEQLKARGGRSVALPLLDPALMYKLDRSGGSLAPSDEEGAPDFSPTQRRRLRHFLQMSWDELGLPSAFHRPPAEAKSEEASVTSPSSPVPQKNPIGAKWVSGPRTVTEVGERSLIHHVRYG